MHPGLESLLRLPEGRASLTRLPRLLEECRERWSLELEEPFAYAFATSAAFATASTGSPPSSASTASAPRGWAIAQTLAWAWTDDRPHSGHVEVARWLLQAE